jgi:hypothetical protein
MPCHAAIENKGKERFLYKKKFTCESEKGIYKII